MSEETTQKEPEPDCTVQSVRVGSKRPEVPSRTFSVGDKVHWSVVTGTGRSFKMSLKRGVIQTLNGVFAVVKLPTGKTAIATIVQLQHEAEQTGTEALLDALSGRKGGR